MAKNAIALEYFQKIPVSSVGQSGDAESNLEGQTVEQPEQTTRMRTADIAYGASVYWLI